MDKAPLSEAERQELEAARDDLLQQYDTVSNPNYWMNENPPLEAKLLGMIEEFEVIFNAEADSDA